MALNESGKAAAMDHLHKVLRQSGNMTIDDFMDTLSGLSDNYTEPSSSSPKVDLYDVPVGIVVLLSIFYGAISLVAVLGNSLVIMIVLTSRRMQTVTNYFIANLALADVVIGLFSIPFQFQAALLQRWNLPDFMCPFCPFFQNLSVNASIFTLTAIAVDRYKAIVYPLSNHASKQRTKIILVCIWLLSVSLAVPQAVAFRVTMMENNTLPQCLPVNVSKHTFKAYMFGLCFVQYFVPLALISFAYIRISLALWGRKMPGTAQDQRDEIFMRNKKKVVKVLMMVVVLFTLAWLPLQGYHVATGIFPNINEFKYINIMFFAAHWLAMSNSCYNPFIYIICHDKFKREYRIRFQCCFRSGNPRNNVQVENRQSTHAGNGANSSARQSLLPRPKTLRTNMSNRNLNHETAMVQLNNASSKPKQPGNSIEMAVLP